MTSPQMANVDYRRIGPTTLAVWKSELQRVNSPLLPHAEEMYTAAGIHSALCLGMMWLENQYATTGIIIQPEDFNPLSARPWIEDPRATKDAPILDWKTREVVGRIKVPEYCAGAIRDAKGGLMLRFNTPADAVREWRRRIIDDRSYKGGVYNGAMTLTEMLGIYAPAGDVHPETGLDNANIEYPKVVSIKLAQFAEMEADSVIGVIDNIVNEGGSVAGFKAHDWSHIGFPGGLVYLPDDIPVEIKIIPNSVAGWTSGTKFKGQTKTTWHDTGNPSSSANGEYNWARSGGRAEINSPGSYNGIFDKDRIIITQRFDEIVGHSGTPSGNRSWAFEQAFGTGFEAGLRVGAALHGGIHAAMGWETDTALVQHNYWSGKHCPAQIRNRGMWSQVVKMTADAARAARIAANGGTSTPQQPVYDTPVLIPELEAFKGKPDYEIPYRVDGNGWVAFYVGDRVQAKKDTRRRRYSNGAGDVGPIIKSGEEFDVDFVIVSTDFPDHYYSPWGTRILAGDTKRVSDVKGG